MDSSGFHSSAFTAKFWTFSALFLWCIVSWFMPSRYERNGLQETDHGHKNTSYHELTTTDHLRWERKTQDEKKSFKIGIIKEIDVKLKLKKNVCHRKLSSKSYMLLMIMNWGLWVFSKAHPMSNVKTALAKFLFLLTHMV